MWRNKYLFPILSMFLFKNDKNKHTSVKCMAQLWKLRIQSAT